MFVENNEVALASRGPGSIYQCSQTWAQYMHHMLLENINKCPKLSAHPGLMRGMAAPQYMHMRTKGRVTVQCLAL